MRRCAMLLGRMCAVGALRGVMPTKEANGAQCTHSALSPKQRALRRSRSAALYFTINRFLNFSPAPIWIIFFFR